MAAAEIAPETSTYYPVDFTFGFTTKVGEKTRILRYLRALQHVGCKRFCLDCEPRFCQGFISYYDVTLWLRVPPRVTRGVFKSMVKYTLRPFGLYYLCVKDWRDFPNWTPTTEEEKEEERRSEESAKKDEDKPFEEVLEENDEDRPRPHSLRGSEVFGYESPGDSGDEDEYV